MKSKNKWIILSVCLAFSVGLTILVLCDQTINIDGWFYDHLIFHNYYFSLYFVLITFWANMGTMLALCGSTLAYSLYKKNNYGLCLILIMIVTVGITQGLKYGVGRIRPLDIALITQSGYAYPSGHTASAVVFYGFLIWLIINSKSSKKYRILISLILVFLIINIGYSRIYLGVHYLSDVLGGAMIGISLLLIGINLIKKYGRIDLK